MQPRTIPNLRKLIKTLPGYDPYLQAEGYKFDIKKASYAICFIRDVIRHAKGPTAGQPFVLSPWQQAFTANLFGWVDKKTGLRRYREAIIYVGKKQGKSAWSAAILLYCMTQDDERGAEIYTAASNREQASLVFSHCVGMIKQNGDLAQRLRVFGKNPGGGVSRSIVYEAMDAVYRPLSSDADSADGVSPSLVIVDEVHRHKRPELAEVLHKSTAARKQPLTLYTTTADYAHPSLCNSLLARAHSVCENEGDESQPGWDPQFLPCVYEAHKDDDWTSPETWKKANPNLGVTVDESFYQREVRKARETPSELTNFLRLHLNIVTDAAEMWLDINKWDLTKDEPLPELQGQTCYGGLDLATSKDIAAFVLVFPLDTGSYALLPRFWIPADNVTARERRDKVPYQSWIRDGYVQTTEGDVIDFDVIRADINSLGAVYDIKEIAADPWNSTQIQTQLIGDGFEVFKFGQGFASMNSPAKEFERLVTSGRIIHGRHPVLRWMAGNVVIKKDPAGNIMPDKARSSMKIDGIVSAIMGLGRSMVATDDTSAYEEHGLTVI